MFKKELIRTAFTKLIKYFMVNVLKITGFHLYIGLKVVDVVWISVISPFIDAEIRAHRMRKRAERQKNVLREIEKVTTKENFGKQVRKLWKTSKELKLHH